MRNNQGRSETISYYDQYARQYAESTQSVDFHDIQDIFLSYLQPSGRILDLGCGAGRDTKYFLSKGYQTAAIDASGQMCQQASKYCGIQVKQMDFRQLHVQNEYDGIWACASLLHVSAAQLPEIFQRIFEALKNDGILYCSFKYGDFEGIRNNRYFTDLTETALKQILRKSAEGQPYELIEKKLWLSGDAMRDRQIKWLNGIYQVKKS